MPGPFDQSNQPFSPGELLPDPLPADPFPIFSRWYEEAHSRPMQPNPNAMTLATYGPAHGGQPRLSARVVLCKELDLTAGGVIFYTNYTSPKSQALEHLGRAAAVFHWDHFERQVRLEGQITKVPATQSDDYFASRPWESRIGAWASQQSKPINSRHDLLTQVRETMQRFGLDPARPPAPTAAFDIPRPPHWGGFRLSADLVELWVSGPGRIHERAVWTRSLSRSPSAWSATRLQP